MLQEEKNRWLQTNTLELRIFDQYFHHHANEILESNSKIKNFFIGALEQKISVNTRIKKKQNNDSPGIEAAALNKEIRRLISGNNDIQIMFEVVEDKGVFYPMVGKIAGFDFAIINNLKNLISLRNICFGELKYHDGTKRWEKYLSENPDLKKLVSLYKLEEYKEGENVKFQKKELGEQPLIVGEIQFGNWALAYRDFFKILKADVQNSVDCLVYIVPTNNLYNYLSDGIVNFNETKKILEEFEKVIPIPIWLIGIDVKL